MHAMQRQPDFTVPGLVPTGAALGLQPYGPDSTVFYQRLVEPGCTSIAAITGGFKTTLMLNAAAWLMLQGHLVAILSMEMQAYRLTQRLMSMLCDAETDDVDGCANEKAAKALLDNMLLCHDASTQRVSPAVVESLLAQASERRCKLLLVDGVETVKCERGVAIDLVDLIDRLARTAARTGIAVLASNQMNRQGFNLEIPDITHLSAAIEKAQRADHVVSLGPRSDTLITASMSKERDGHGDGEQEVFRLIVKPSLRIEVMDSGFLRPGDYPVSPPAPYYVGCHVHDITGEGEEEAEPDVYQPTMKVYHGTDGFVPLGRAVFGSPMFTNREAENIIHLLDLYSQAQFVPSAMRAPGTHQTVELQRGQLLTSINMLARRWNTSAKVVRTFIDRAVADGLIRQEIIYADGTRRVPESLADLPAGASRKKVCSVITCLHYEGNQMPAVKKQSKEGT